MIGHGAVGRGLVLRVERPVFLAFEEVLRHVTHLCSNLGRVVAQPFGQQPWVLVAEHHRTCGVDHEDALICFSMRQQSRNVALRLLNEGLKIALFPRGHAAAHHVVSARRAAAVERQDVHDVLTEFWVVVFHPTRGEQDRLVVGSGCGDHVTGLLLPLGEGHAREIRLRVTSVDADDLLLYDPKWLDLLRHVRRAEAGTRQRPCPVRVGQQFVSEGRLDPLLLQVDCSTSVDQGGEVEQEFVFFARGVRALDLAQLALEAGVQGRVQGGDGQALNVAILSIDGIEEDRKGAAVLEAHAAAVADFDGPFKFDLHLSSVPIDLVGGVVGQPIGGHERSAHVGLVVALREVVWVKFHFGHLGSLRCRACRLVHLVNAAQCAFHMLSRSDWKRPAWDFSAFARVSNQSATSSKPSSRAVLAKPGYMSVYS